VGQPAGFQRVTDRDNVVIQARREEAEAAAALAAPEPVTDTRWRRVRHDHRGHTGK
jgi:hypothetical protein